jgi:hypothetical protein
MVRQFPPPPISAPVARGKTKIKAALDYFFAGFVLELEMIVVQARRSRIEPNRGQNV